MAGVFDKDEEYIDLSQTLKVLKRNKKTFLKTSFSIISIVIVFTVIQRFFLPTYQGSFVLLISDPFPEGQNSASSSRLRRLRSSIGISNSSNDIPTIIEILKSQSVLKPIAKENNLSLKNLKKNLKIKTGGVRRKEARGILKVSITSNSKKKTEKLIQSIENSFFKTEAKFREQKALNQFEFLKKQELATALNTFKSDSQILSGIKKKQEYMNSSSKEELIEAIKVTQNKTNWSLLQKSSVDDDPISPKESLNLIFGLVLAVIGGFTAIFLKENKRQG